MNFFHHFFFLGFTDNHNHLHHSGTRDNAAVSEPSHAWTAHKTDTGVFYYYNAVTGVSTYEKPPGFKEVCTITVKYGKFLYCRSSLGKSFSAFKDFGNYIAGDQTHFSLLSFMLLF
jgi:hypothetical protein